ncbi:histidine kinase [Bernardetia sp.]|uniref:tetratricopeptide repeat-containing sensor histidine kinase n=1 Tax=Bernardetia sp. TaxID=1937974 RepID=UPI0025C09B1C|nr:histidine kinase [Bernardetia sp.]
MTFINAKTIKDKVITIDEVFAEETLSNQETILRQTDSLFEQYPQDSLLKYVKLYQHVVVEKSKTKHEELIKNVVKVKDGFERHGASIRQRLRIISLITELYGRNNNIKEALDYSLKAIDLIEQSSIEDKLFQLGSAYIDAAQIMSLIGDKRFKEYGRKGITLIEKSSQSINAQVLMIKYANYALILRRQNMYDSALIYAQKAKLIIDKTPLTLLKIKTNQLIASIYEKKGDIPNSLYYLEKTVEKLKENENESASILVYYNLGKLYNQTGKYDLSIKNLNKTIVIGKNLNQQDVLYNTYSLLAKVYRKQNKNELAYESLNQSIVYGDSIRKKRNEKESREIISKYETEKKEQQIIQLTQENKIKELEARNSYYFTIASILIGIGFLIGLWMFFRQRSIIQNFERIQAQLRWRRAQVNPHFFFNVLSTLQTLLYEKRIQEAQKHVSGFSLLMRQILEDSDRELVSLEEEIKFLNTYLNLEKLSVDFDFEIVLQPNDLEIEDIFIPPMLLQPFVENAIEHGLSKSDKEYKKLYLNVIELNDDKIQISVKDNGVGRSEKRKKKHISMAIAITQERKKLMKNTFDFEIIDHKDKNQNSTGTEVIFIIKV